MRHFRFLRTCIGAWQDINGTSVRQLCLYWEKKKNWRLETFIYWRFLSISIKQIYNRGKSSLTSSVQYEIIFPKMFTGFHNKKYLALPWMEEKKQSQTFLCIIGNEVRYEGVKNAHNNPLVFQSGFAKLWLIHWFFLCCLSFTAFSPLIQTQKL